MAGGERWEVAARVLVLAIGGACGVNARYWLGLLVGRWAGGRFPWATVGINVSGSFAIGLGAVVLAGRWPHPYIRLFALTGLLGGYTTFSAYMLESVILWDAGDRPLAAGNLVGSVVGGLAATLLGMALGRYLVEPPRPAPRPTAPLERRIGAIGDAVAGREPPDRPAT